MNSSVKFFEPIVSVVAALAALRWISFDRRRLRSCVLLEAAGSSSPLAARGEQQEDQDDGCGGAQHRRDYPAPARRRARERSRLLDEAGLLQVVARGVGRLLLVDVHAGVELLHDLVGQRLLDVLDDLLALGPSFSATSLRTLNETL